MKDTDPMPFGKYRGYQMKDVPDSYLTFLYSQGRIRVNYSALHKYIVKNAKLLPDLILDDRDKKR